MVILFLHPPRKLKKYIVTLVCSMSETCGEYEQILKCLLEHACGKNQLSKICKKKMSPVSIALLQTRHQLHFHTATTDIFQM